MQIPTTRVSGQPNCPNIQSPLTVNYGPQPFSIEGCRCPGEGRTLAAALVLSVLIAFVGLAVSLGLGIVVVALGLAYIRLRQSSLLGNSIPVTDRTYPLIHQQLLTACSALSAEIPRTYVVQDPSLNAFSMGFSRPYSVVLNSGLVDSLTPDELQFVIGHEVGHILAGHTKWLSFVSPAGSQMIPGFDLLFGFWQRKTEYTADRVGYCATGNVDAATRALVKVACGPKALEHVDVHQILGQLGNFNETDLTYRLGEMLGTHPYMTHRIRELVMFDRRRSGNPLGRCTCPGCGRPVSAESRYCTTCGTQLACLACRTLIRHPGDRFCRSCGKPLGARG